MIVDPGGNLDPADGRSPGRAGGHAEEMTRDRKAKAVTLAILSGAFGIVLGQKSGWRMPQKSQAKTEATPQNVIYAMLDAARAGDTKANMRS